MSARKPERLRKVPGEPGIYETDDERYSAYRNSSGLWRVSGPGIPSAAASVIDLEAAQKLVAKAFAADQAAQAAKVMHVRRQLRRSTSTSYYLDRSDRGQGTYCGADTTDLDTDYQSRNTTYTKQHACADCLAAIEREATR